MMDDEDLKNALKPYVSDEQLVKSEIDFAGYNRLYIKRRVYESLFVIAVMFIAYISFDVSGAAQLVCFMSASVIIYTRSTRVVIPVLLGCLLGSLYMGITLALSLSDALLITMASLVINNSARFLYPGKRRKLEPSP